MEFEELPETMQEAFKDLRFCSASIECDVHDALESAEDIEDFRNNVSNTIDSMIAELQNVRKVFCGASRRR
jgi:hypothetical protein